MDAREFEELLNDLETRVDRLRALYENWFRGYEKMEPQVARKDVERRVYGLRKELPRNTALRFRYHQLYQRYTSLASYWSRTARQIEEGTYRLQLQRFRRKKGPEREGADRDAEGASALSREGSERPGPQAYELDWNESLSVDDLLSEVELEAVARAVDSPGPARDPFEPSRVQATFSRPLRNSQAPRGAVPKTSEPQGSSPLSPQRGSVRRPSPFDDDNELPTGLHVSLDDGGRGNGRSPGAGRPSDKSSDLGVRPAVRNGGTAASPAVPGPDPRVSPPPLLGKPAQPAGGARPVPPTPAAPVPQPPLAPARPPAPAGPMVMARPATASAAQGAPPPSGGITAGRPPPRAPGTGPAPSSAAGINDQHMRRIYDEYAAARRKNNEGDVRYEAVVSSIQRMLPDLQKKHAGKQIDFEVVLKDGRVGLKPKPT